MRCRGLNNGGGSAVAMPRVPRRRSLRRPAAYLSITHSAPAQLLQPQLLQPRLARRGQCQLQLQWWHLLVAWLALALLILLRTVDFV